MILQKSHPQARTHPEALILRFDAPLYHANVSYLEEWLTKAVADRPHLKHIVVDCRGVNTVDATAVEGLEELVSGYSTIRRPGTPSRRSAPMAPLKLRRTAGTSFAPRRSPGGTQRA